MNPKTEFRVRKHSGTLLRFSIPRTEKKAMKLQCEDQLKVREIYFLIMIAFFVVVVQFSRDMKVPARRKEGGREGKADEEANDEHHTTS